MDELIDFVPTTCCPELGSSNAKYLVDPKLGDWWVGIVSGVSGAKRGYAGVPARPCIFPGVWVYLGEKIDPSR